MRLHRVANVLLAVHRLVGGRRQHQNLVPLVREQLRVDLHRDVHVEGQLARPRDQLVHDGITDVAELVPDLRLVGEELTKMRQGRYVLHSITVYKGMYHVQGLLVRDRPILGRADGVVQSMA